MKSAYLQHFLLSLGLVLYSQLHVEPGVIDAEMQHSVQQSVDSAMCVFYSLANALQESQKKPYYGRYQSDFFTRQELLATHFASVYEHKVGEAVSLRDAYNKIVENKDLDATLLKKAVERGRIISLDISQLSEAITLENRKKLEKIKQHCNEDRPSAIIVFAQDRGIGSHAFCIGIDKNRNERIKVFDSVDVKYHHEKNSLDEDKKDQFSSNKFYQNRVEWLSNFLFSSAAIIGSAIKPEVKTSDFINGSTEIDKLKNDLKSWVDGKVSELFSQIESLSR
jgi:hypothetical protein